MTDPTPDERIAAEVRAPTEVALESDGARWTLVLRRRFRHDPERLWRMLTDPDRQARWSPVVTDRPLTEPGPATSRENPGDEPRDAEVLVADAPRLLVHRWGRDLLRWTIAPTQDGTLLELRQTFDDRAWGAALAAGWQVCLGALAATDDGIERERPVGQRAMAYGWQELHDRYEPDLAGP